MADNKKICFVIMGFGKKTDFRNERTLDLDKTYENIIEPAVCACGFECIRADAIKESGLIDRSMYALLLMADLVIADITTYNPNALYELGIRHAARPFTTIILKDNYKDEKIPFDLDHERIFMYKHLGDDIGASESRRCIGELRELINKVITTPYTDSPLYGFWNGVQPLSIPEQEYEQLLKRLISKNDSLQDFAEQAKNHMAKKEFIAAAELWHKASLAAPNEVYYLQQEALCVYKSKSPDPVYALYEALSIINKDQSMDIETLSIRAAIYKNLFKLTEVVDHLDQAIDLYNKAYVLSGNYYPGENYAICLLIKGQTDRENKNHYNWQASEVCESIISEWDSINKGTEKRSDRKWIYATLANCYRLLNNVAQSIKFEDAFKHQHPDEWELETYYTTRKFIEKCKSSPLKIAFKK